MKVMVETSARHAHLSNEHLAILFGEGATLTNKKDLSQPGQYACEEKVEVVGPKGSIVLTILGPTRSETQVELAATEARKLGLKAPVRESGDLVGSAGCTIKGPKGEIVIDKGVIIAKRHIHMRPEDAEACGVKDKQIVSVKVGENGGRSLIFGDVVCRVNSSYALAMHVDTDESNAAGLSGAVDGEIIV
ncbi:PduL/EutD family phosphate acyltransferase [Scatolibacter rhodanostii]|uniref:PduL/EutD family phosphate acyltransferase n=1 Tax=Scatolibacter rhodanostii TaxID=2014781 RepID=UPI000C07D913|nr:phosphate propanoyltransferase [Scatolibacter rhodanostii]